jgi:hypothetical protein
MNWPYNPTEESITWFREKAGLEPNLLEALTKANKPHQIQKLLSKHGAPGPYVNASRGLTIGDVDAALSSPDNLDKVEIMFLMCCHDAVKKDTTITGLVDAVQRQTSFVGKMEKQLWIRSPAVQGTLCRAIDRYSKFLKLSKLYPATMLVPTLDIDLAWHTHQCSPFQYEQGTVKMAGWLIYHNDKLQTETLNTGLAKTKDLYRIRFGQQYQVCNCWDCEALLSTAEDLESRTESEAIASKVHESVAYHRAVEIARRKGQSRLPVRIRKT